MESHTTASPADETTTAATPKPKAKKKHTTAESAATVVVTLILIWVVRSVEGWHIPFILDSWDRVLPLLTASLIVSLVVHALFLIYRPAIFVYLGKTAADIMSILVSARFLTVFPFDFGLVGIEVLNLIARIGLIVSIVGIVIGMIVRTVTLISQHSPELP